LRLVKQGHMLNRRTMWIDQSLVSKMVNILYEGLYFAQGLSLANRDSLGPFPIDFVARQGLL